METVSVNSAHRSATTAPLSAPLVFPIPAYRSSDFFARSVPFFALLTLPSYSVHPVHQHSRHCHDTSW